MVLGLEALGHPGFVCVPVFLTKITLTVSMSPGRMKGDEVAARGPILA